jgi:hypothetical protein
MIALKNLNRTNPIYPPTSGILKICAIPG